MRTTQIKIKGTTFPLVSLNTLIVGSGAAALNAAACLHGYGQRDIAVVTERFGGGTSNNAGSDKQTYYKLSLAGDVPDSPLEMARDLFAGGSMHGDIALCEAQNSLAAFFRLVELGVPFPHDRYGAYAGYKTDHDPRQRATSAGPLTSRLMFEALAGEVKAKGIRIFDRHPVIALLTKKEPGEKKVVGAIALDRDRLGGKNLGFVIFNAVNVVLGTGGPAGIYKASVYPESQTGSHGMAFEAGAVGVNLTESQYGLASVKFRWNLSGTYQQVIPRYISTDQKGRDEREFLNDFFPDMGSLATAIFLKGYQWPFDPRKATGYGSSLIDILVYQETIVKGRRVFLDFKRNPDGGGKLDEFSFRHLSPEAYGYLEKSGALLPTPIDRLRHMNQPAIDIYKDHGIDLAGENLEIAVCAQHNNGGLGGNLWWESNIRHLFPVGEANGTHGIYRPGGSALNSGQVGSMRAALFIAKKYNEPPLKTGDFLEAAAPQIEAKFALAKAMIFKGRARPTGLGKAKREFQCRMSTFGAHVRNPKDIGLQASQAWRLYERLKKGIRLTSSQELPDGFKVIDLCLAHAVYLEAVREYLDKGGRSRGSYLVLDPAGEKPCPQLDQQWRFSLESPDSFVSRNILEVVLDEKMKPLKRWVDIRPIPAQAGWFENVWNDYRKDKIFGSD